MGVLGAVGLTERRYGDQTTVKAVQWIVAGGMSTSVAFLVFHITPTWAFFVTSYFTAICYTSKPALLCSFCSTVGTCASRAMVFIPSAAFLSYYQVFPPNHFVTFRQDGVHIGRGARV